MRHEADYGKVIKTLLKRKGMSQRQLAKELGLSENAVSQFMTNYSHPSRYTMLKISELFGIPDTIIRFFAIEESMKRQELNEQQTKKYELFWPHIKAMMLDVFTE